jgi:hypothetical protein
LDIGKTVFAATPAIYQKPQRASAEIHERDEASGPRRGGRYWERHKQVFVKVHDERGDDGGWSKVGESGWRGEEGA